MLDLNARINWRPGMELTAQTFLEMDSNLDYRQQMAIRAALGEHCIGLLPGMPFSAEGVFYTNKYEIDNLQLTAILPSGRIIQVDEPVSIAIPLLYGNTYYLTVGFGEGETPYEKEGVPYIRPQYSYAIMAPDELTTADVMPIIRFSVNAGELAVDSSFIPPCLLLSAHSAFADYHQRLTEQVRTLSEHANLREGDGKRTLMRYFFLMKSLDMMGRVSEYIRLLHEIAQAVDYFIMVPYAELHAEVARPEQTDIALWLDWLLNYLNGAHTVLDGLELEDDTIDYEALLAQAKQELYERLNPELYEKLLLQIKDELRDEISRTLTTTLTAYMNDTLKPELEQLIADNLHDRIYDKLYNELYDRLYNALYVPVEEEENFIPTI
ncbi:MAG: type VI secretion system baseplate subunit TssK [Paludibacteraceae bacterium]|nr:type VI secretion system baseplate subunit TssK [Paludibacteraceae bacterium]